jgi:hypothetical protein
MTGFGQKHYWRTGITRIPHGNQGLENKGRTAYCYLVTRDQGPVGNLFAVDYDSVFGGAIVQDIIIALLNDLCMNA